MTYWIPPDRSKDGDIYVFFATVVEKFAEVYVNITNTYTIGKSAWSLWAVHKWSHANLNNLKKPFYTILYTQQGLKLSIITKFNYYKLFSANCKLHFLWRKFLKIVLSGSLKGTIIISSFIYFYKFFHQRFSWMCIIVHGILNKCFLYWSLPESTFVITIQTFFWAGTWYEEVIH